MMRNTTANHFVTDDDRHAVLVNIEELPPFVLTPREASIMGRELLDAALVAALDIADEIEARYGDNP